MYLEGILSVHVWLTFTRFSVQGIQLNEEQEQSAVENHHMKEQQHNPLVLSVEQNVGPVAPWSR